MGCRPNLWAIKGAPCPPVVTSCSALIIPIPSLLLSHSTLFVTLAPSHLVVPPFHFLSLPLLSVPNCSKAHLNSLGSAASPALPADVASPPRLRRLPFTLALISVLSIFPFTNPTLPACRSSRVPNSPSSPF